MKHLLFILFLALCAAAHAQTIRTLGYNSTNGQIVTTTNVVWTNAFSFSTNAVAAQVRTNLGLGQTDNVQFNEISGQSITLYGGGGIVFDDSEAPAATRTNLGLNNTNVYVYAAQAIWDEVNEKVGLQLEDMDFRVADEMVKTNGPTNATNAVRWMTVLKGTNIYKLPLYQ